YYAEAEKLYCVHGKMGLDPTEPFRSAEFPFPPISHEPRIQELHDDLSARGLHPFFMPMGVKLNETNPLQSECIRCNTCDGFPCLLHAKSDADINCVRPAMANNQVTLLTEAKVERLVTTANGNEIDYIEVTRQNETIRFKASIIVVACGAINSAALLLKSANDKHPDGLANS
ncbi:MAG TPA: dehydrogenase, partial [Chitinophagaceae bacterium]|nr:dehydrogenase [Chitinophagaceae bacterium]